VRPRQKAAHRGGPDVRVLRWRAPRRLGSRTTRIPSR
jgi:hypothetical protein